MTIYDQFKSAGCEIDSHESDLFVKATPDAWRVVRDNMPLPHSAFRSQIDGEHWIEIPFAYSPFWERKHAQLSKDV